MHTKLHPSGNGDLFHAHERVVREDVAHRCVPDGVVARGRMKPAQGRKHGHTAVLEFCFSETEEFLIRFAFCEAGGIPEVVGPWATSTFEDFGAAAGACPK